MRINIPAFLSELELKFPANQFSVVENKFGSVITVRGKNARAVANVWCSENFLRGSINTPWRDVRHGIGYAIPLYDNPLDRYL